MTIRFTFSSSTADLKVGRKGISVNDTIEKTTNFSGSGKSQTVNQYAIQEISFDAYFSESIERKLRGWWGYVSRGNSFTFAYDTTKTANTTLNGSVSAGGTTIPLTSISSVTAGYEFLLRTSDNDQNEIVIVDATFASGVTLTSGTQFAYSSGDTFRSRYYWPDIKVDMDDFNPTKNGDNFSYTFKFYEAL